MEIKMFEVRDRMTMIPVMAIKLIPRDVHESYLLGVAGFGSNPTCIQVISFNRHKTTYDRYGWDNRTMIAAHECIERDWEELGSGAVIDVEFFLGETQVKKESERLIK